MPLNKEAKSNHLQTSIQLIDKTQTDTTSQDQSGSRSNGNEGILPIRLSSRTEALPSDAVQCHTQSIPFVQGGLTLLQGIQSAFSKLCQQGKLYSDPMPKLLWYKTLVLERVRRHYIQAKMPIIILLFLMGIMTIGNIDKGR